MDDNKKLYISIFLPSLSGGGAERVVFNLIHGLQMNDVQVDLIVTFEDGIWHQQLPTNCSVTNLNTRHVLPSLFPLVRHIREKRPDIVFSAIDNANLVNVLACKLSGIKVKSVISIHQVSSEFRKLYENFREKILNLATRIVFPFADKVIAVSNNVKEDLIKSIKISDEKVMVIGNPILLNCELEKLDSYKKDKSDFVNIVAFGRLALEKDFSTLIQAFHLFLEKKAGYLTIYGIGPERNTLLNQIFELNLSKHVSLAGFVEDVFHHMKQADLCVVSSITEGFSNVIVEALACGVPVVSTDCGGPREILQDGVFGLLVPINNVDLLTQAMQEASKRDYDPSILRNRAKDFTIETISLEYLKLFQSLVRNHS